MARPPSDVRECAQAVAARWGRTPRAGLVLGSGLGPLAEQIEAEAEFDYENLPGFPRSTAIGHRGRLVCGLLDGVPVVAFQGRFHPYEGHSFAAAATPASLSAELGCSTLVVSNAAGGVNPGFRPGDLMLIEDHINLLFRCDAPSDRRTVPAYDTDLRAAAASVARQQGVHLHRGVYVAMLGPTYETRAEYRMVRKLGGDAAGMSTVPEAVTGALAGLRVLGISVITNVGFPDALAETSGHEVIGTADAASGRLMSIVRGVLRQQP